ncbi:MAG: HEPN domain-containing protein [Bacteroidia bacterium]
MRNDDVKKWLGSAESDMELSLKGKASKKILYITLCYHSQQAVEKSLKAVLIHLDKRYPHTHDISVLFNLIEETNIEIPNIIKPATEFTKYVIWRYPDDIFEIEKEEYKHVIVIAQKVLKWAKSIIKKDNSKLF